MTVLTKVLVVLGVLLALDGRALAQSRRCDVGSFRGAASGPVTVTMRVVNDGKPCGVTNYGVPAELRHPATDGVITREPRHGKAEFSGPRVDYTPNPGYVGEDSFAYEARATNDAGRPLVLRVQINVTVRSLR